MAQVDQVFPPPPARQALLLVLVRRRQEEVMPLMGLFLACHKVAVVRMHRDRLKMVVVR